MDVVPWGGRQDGADLCQHISQVVLNSVSRKADKADAEGFNDFLPLAISFLLLSVNRAINLNRQPCFRTIKVQDKCANRELTAKLVTIQPAVAERFP
jgi:hypothetical protein